MTATQRSVIIQAAQTRDGASWHNAPYQKLEGGNMWIGPRVKAAFFSCVFLLLLVTQEAATRLKAAAQQNAAAADSTCSLITLHMKDAPVDAVYSEIARQAGVRLAPPAGRSLVPNVSMDVEQQPFWRVIHQLAGQTGFAPAPSLSADFEREILLRSNPGWANARSYLSGCVLFVADSVSFNQSYSYISQTQTQSSISLRIYAYVDPKVDVLELMALRLDEAVDENGKSILIDPRYGGALSGGGGIGGLLSGSIRLAFSRDTGKRIARLKGSARFALCTKRETWEVADIRNAKDVVRIMSPGTYTIKGLENQADNPSAYILRIEIEQAGATRSLTPLTIFGAFPNGPRLLDENGRAYQSGGGGGGTAGGGPLRYSFRFRDPANDSQKLGPPARLIWNIPVEMKELGVPLELTDLPIPIKTGGH